MLRPVPEKRKVLESGIFFFEVSKSFNRVIFSWLVRPEACRHWSSGRVGCLGSQSFSKNVYSLNILGAPSLRGSSKELVKLRKNECYRCPECRGKLHKTCRSDGAEIRRSKKTMNERTNAGQTGYSGGCGCVLFHNAAMFDPNRRNLIWSQIQQTIQTSP